MGRITDEGVRFVGWKKSCAAKHGANMVRSMEGNGHTRFFGSAFFMLFILIVDN